MTQVNNQNYPRGDNKYSTCTYRDSAGLVPSQCAVPDTLGPNIAARTVQEQSR